MRSVLRGAVGGRVRAWRITHEDDDGTIVTIAAGSWATWCERAWTQGGKYERGGDV